VVHDRVVVHLAFRAPSDLDAVLGDDRRDPDAVHGVPRDIGLASDLVHEDSGLLVLVQRVVLDVDDGRPAVAALHEDPLTALTAFEAYAEVDVAYRVVIDHARRISVVDPDELRCAAVRNDVGAVDREALDLNPLCVVGHDDRGDCVS
jgi:hypothetical protein